jgi:hypothetical protein
MKTKIPTDTFVALTDEIADLLMCVDLGDEKYESLLVMSNGGQTFNDEGLDMYIEWNNQVEEMLSTYFKMED